jgi:hypothetical protein
MDWLVISLCQVAGKDLTRITGNALRRYGRFFTGYNVHLRRYCQGKPVPLTNDNLRVNTNRLSAEEHLTGAHKVCRPLFFSTRCFSDQLQRRLG